MPVNKHLTFCAKASFTLKAQERSWHCRTKIFSSTKHSHYASYMAMDPHLKWFCARDPQRRIFWFKKCEEFARSLNRK